MIRVFTYGLRDWGSIPGRVIPETQKWYLIPRFLTLGIIKYESRVGGAILGKSSALPYTSVL